MAESNERHFDAWTNSYDATPPPATPDEPTVYHRTLSDGEIAGPLTEAEIAEALAGLAEQGYVTATWTPTAPRRTFSEAEIARIAEGDYDPAPAIVRIGVTDRLLRAIDDLGVATREYCTTGDVLVSTQILRNDTAARTSTREDIVRVHHDAAIESGKNETQRKMIAARLLNDDSMLRGLRQDTATLDGDCLRYERAHKNAYHLMDSLRAQIAGLTALLAH